MSESLSRELLLELLSLGVATLYEASNLPCALDAAIKPVWPGARLAGPAFTVRCHPGDNLALHHALAQARPGDVLVVQAGGLVAGYWGEVMAVAAQARGIAGLVIDGGVRDVDELQRLGFPAFARGVAVFRTAKHEAGELGAPVVVGGVRVEPGDVVVGDSDGVLALAPSRLEATLAAGRARREKERGVLERLRRGELTIDIYGWRK